jgi:ubiquinone/menaquinone biosynthesis C-methylase UbiE
MSSTSHMSAAARSLEAEEYRRTSFEIWEAMAPGWERWRAQLEEALTPVREWLISELAPYPDETVLELGAGTGDTGFAAAAILGERGRLISSDFSPAMVEVARRRGAQLGLGNVDYRVIDAERIELGEGSIDGVLC